MSFNKNSWDSINHRVRPSGEFLSSLHSMVSHLDALDRDWDKYFPNKEKRPYQIEHIKAVINGLVRKVKWEISKKAVAVVAPPAAGKTFEMLILAHLMWQKSVPSIIGMRNTSNIYSPDGALQLFQSFFGSENIWVVDGQSNDFSKPITFITAASFATKANQFPQHKQVNIMLDEWDTFQSDMRQTALDTLIARNNAFVSVFSATKVVNQRSISERADIVSEMPLTELIKLWYAKHIQWYYYTGDIHITDSNIVHWEVGYDTLRDVEKKRLVNSAYQIYQENPNKKMLIHCQSVDQCKETYYKFSQHGVSVAYITNEGVFVAYDTNEVSDQNRRDVEREYIDWDLLVLISCDIYGRWFSDKWVTETEVFAEISWSVTKVYQKIMRGWRPHPEHKLLKIYQLLPSTIKTRTFVPVLMHQCFNMDLEDLDSWVRVHPYTDVPKWLQPIEFVNVGQKPSATPMTSSNEHLEKLSAKPSDYEPNDSIQYAHIDQIRNILSTENDYKHFLLNKYIQDHFIELVDNILKARDIGILDIQKIASQQQNFIVGTIQIDNEEIELTYLMFRSAIYQIVSWWLKNQADHNAWIVNAIIIQWYMTGEPPVYNTVKDLLEVRGKRRSTAPMRDKYVYEHALELLDNFVSIGVKREDSPHHHKSKVVTHDAISIKYAKFLTSVLAHCLWWANQDIAHDNNVLAHDIVWSRKETWVCSDNVAEKLIQHICSLVDYVKWDFKNIYESFLRKYNFDHNDIKFTFAHDDKVSFTVTKDRFKKYIQHKKIKMTHEWIDEKFPHDVMTSIELIWRDITRMLIRRPFSPEYLKDNSLTRSHINYNNSMQSKLVERMLNDTLTSDIALWLINWERDTTELLSAENYYIAKNLDRIVEEGSINRNAPREEFNDPTIKIHSPKSWEKFISITSMLSYFIIYVTWKDVKSLIQELWIAEITFKRNIVKPLLLKYISLSPQDRDNISYKDVKKMHTFYIEKISQKRQVNYQIDHEKCKLDKQDFLNRPQSRKKILDALHPDEDTLASFGLDREHLQYLHDLLHTESKRDSLMADIRERPTSFLHYWLDTRIWEDMLWPSDNPWIPDTIIDVNPESVTPLIPEPIEDRRLPAVGSSDGGVGKQIIEFPSIKHDPYSYTRKEELSSIVYNNFFIWKSHTDRYSYFNALSQRRNDVNIKLKKHTSDVDKMLIFNYVNKASLLDMLIPYIKWIANELEQFLGISKIKTNTRFLKNNTIGTHEYVISDLLVEQFLKNKNFVDVIKEYINSIEYNNLITKEPGNLWDIKEKEQDFVKENAIIEVRDIYDIPTPTDIKNMISSCITSKWERDQKQWNIIQSNFDPQRVEIINQLSLSLIKNIVWGEIYEHLHNMYIRKVYYNSDNYNSSKRSKLLETTNYEYAKEYIIAIYCIIDRILTNAKRTNKYKREVAKEVLDYKKQISQLLTLQYDDIMKLSTDKIKQHQYHDILKIFTLFDELLVYVKMI